MNKQQILHTLSIKLPNFPADSAQRASLLRGLGRFGVLPTGSPFSRVIHECQYKFIFRELYFQTYPEDPTIRPTSDAKHPTTNILKRLAHQKINKRLRDSMLLQSMPRNMGRTVVNQFYNKGNFGWWSIIHSANSEIDRSVLADLLLGAIGPPRINPEWRTSSVMSLLKGIRAEEDFSLMPIIGDALQDAGCDDAHLINRLREAHYFSLGDWLFKATGLIG